MGHHYSTDIQSPSLSPPPIQLLSVTAQASVLSHRFRASVTVYLNCSTTSGATTSTTISSFSDTIANPSDRKHGDPQHLLRTQTSNPILPHPATTSTTATTAVSAVISALNRAQQLRKPSNHDNTRNTLILFYYH